VHLPIDIETVKGFLDPREGVALAEAAASVVHLGAAVEIGSYCGKSTVYLGSALKQAGGVLLAIDHHRGSEENQPGEEYHDPDLADGQGGMSSLTLFRDTLRRAGLEDVVVPVVAPSALAARALQGGFGFVFIDGGHSMPAALADYRNWAGRIVTGGILAIHDVFPNVADGGRPPHEIYKLALHSGMFQEEGAVASLRLLRRL
jgi:predicted O-methyltransferase YrrM